MDNEEKIKAVSASMAATPPLKAEELGELFTQFLTPEALVIHENVLVVEKEEGRLRRVRYVQVVNGNSFEDGVAELAKQFNEACRLGLVDGVITKACHLTLLTPQRFKLFFVCHVSSHLLHGGGRGPKTDDLR